MQACSLESRAKINLYLQIVGKRPDGYHELVMILQSIQLSDTVHLALKGQGIQIRCDHPQVPTDPSNLAYRAAALLQSEFDCPGDVEIVIEKRIPVAAGLAGGSTNAAAVLVGLNQLWGLGLTVADLQSLGAKLGSDVPFCIDGGTQLATGRGEVLEPLNALAQVPLLLAKPIHLAVSTAWAYGAYRTSQPKSDPPSLPELLTALNRQDIPQMVRYIHNDLETPVLAHYSEVAQLKSLVADQGALAVMMSGSGPSVFGVMSDPVDPDVIDHLKSVQPSCEFWSTSTASTGITLC